MAKPKRKSVSTKEAAGGAAPQKKRGAEAASAPRAASAETARRPPRSDDANAFIPDPANDGPAHADDDLAEVLAEDFLESATQGNDVFEDELGRALPDEIGGPFVVTDSDEELADDVDASNPIGAERAPRPRAVGSLAQRPRAEQAADEGDQDDQEDDDEDDDDEDDTDEIEAEVEPENLDRKR
jgi:hypothetical protein